MEDGMEDIKEQDIKFLNRYTTLPVLLDMLKRKRLVLLDPTTWEDKNDAEILLIYKKRRKIRKLFALCFSYDYETIHHWKTYADGISGCCIEFDAKKLIALLETMPEVRKGVIKYKKIKDLDDDALEVDDIPFTKRWPYRCENEFRLIWEGKTTKKCYEIPFDLHMITKVTISQRMPDQLYKTIQEILRETLPEQDYETIQVSLGDRFDQSERSINHSTLTLNQEWIKKFKKV
jgi:hypothetical protein